MPGLSGVYKIQSIVSPNKFYVGSAVCLPKRQREHLRDLKNNKHKNIKLQNHYNKYGGDDMVFSVLARCDIKDLIPTEQSFIDSCNPWFNICKKAGSTLGKPAYNKGIPMSEEQKVKIRAARKLQENPFQGRHHSAETKRKLAETSTGKKHSEEHKKKISNGLKGRECSEETRKKIGDAQRGKKRPQQSGEKHHYYGKKHSPEVRERIKQARKKQANTRKGVPCSEETKAKIRAARKLQVNTRKGIPQSAEVKERLRLINTGKSLSEETRRKLSEKSKADWAKRKSDQNYKLKIA